MSQIIHKVTIGPPPGEPQRPKVTNPSNTNTFKKIGQAALLGALGIFAAGNGIYTYKATQEYAQTETRLTSEINQNKALIDGLNKLLEEERSLNASQAGQMSTLNNDLTSTKAAAVSFLEKINGLRAEMSSMITLDEIKDVARKVSRSTVMVEGEVELTHRFTGETRKFPVLGSGVIVSSISGRKYILTNGHVTEGTDMERNEFKDNVYHIKLYNGTDFENPIEFDSAPVLLSNGQRAYSAPGEHDIALLEIPPDIKVPPELGVSIRNLANDPVQVGEPVITIGNPFGERDSVSFGIASHIDRKAEELNKNHHIQTDAAINPGNSGGAMVDLNGKLIGINTWGYSNAGGVGGAIRIDDIIKTIESWGIKLQL